MLPLRIKTEVLQNGWRAPMLTRSSAERVGGSPPPRKFDDLLRQIADGETFRTAPTMRALLVYLWEHQNESVSEYAIATEALGRPSDFDPKLDSTVRVQVARLRTKLKEFYETAGDTFPLRLTLPRGGHELQWTHLPRQEAPVPILSGVPKRYLWGAGAIGLALVILCVGSLMEIRRLKASLPPPATPIPRFWQSFLMPGKPTAIVVPSPLYFFWPSRQVYVRDLKISDFPN